MSAYGDVLPLPRLSAHVLRPAHSYGLGGSTGPENLYLVIISFPPLSVGDSARYRRIYNNNKNNVKEIGETANPLTEPRMRTLTRFYLVNTRSSGR